MNGILILQFEDLTQLMQKKKKTHPLNVINEK
jgi:hypothetical protein